MDKREVLALRIIAISLMAVAITNFATTATALELRLNLRWVWVSCVSWSLVWLSGFIIAVISVGIGGDKK